MTDSWIYLDYNASTPMDPEVVEVMKTCLDCQGHPSSPHPHGQAAAAAINTARNQVAQTLGCSPEEIIFCSGSTEASNHVIKGIAFSPERRGKTLHFISSCVDHAATIQPLNFLQDLGHEVTFLGVDKQGQISTKELKQALRPNTALVTLIHGQNEIGTVQPLEEVGALCQAEDILFHVDASQSLGKVPVKARTLGADFLNIAGHKVYGPKGVGALYVRQGRQLEPLLHGGGHEKGWRSGTPAPQLIAGLGQACALVDRLGPVPAAAMEHLWQGLSSKLGDRVRRNGHPTERLPNVLHLTFRGVNGRELLNAAQISASTGAACHSASVSPVLSAMGFTPEEAQGSVRLSGGRSTDIPTATQATEALLQAYAELTQESGVYS